MISYGVYLWHWPMVVWLTPTSTGLDGPGLFALRLVATLAIAGISFIVVERPIRQGRLWHIRLRPLTAFAAAAACLVVLSAGSVLATRGWQPVPAFLREDAACRCPARDGGEGRRRHRRRQHRAEPLSGVRRGGHGTPLHDGVGGDGRVRGGDQKRVEENGAPTRQTQRCTLQAPELQSRMVRAYRPDVIYWYTGRDRYDIRAGDRVLQAGSPEWLAAAYADWDRTLDRLRTKGAEVRLVLPFFNEGADPAPCIEPADLAVEACTQPLQNGALRQVYRDWAAHHPGGVTVVDVADRLCPVAPCLTAIDGVALRRPGDIIHFSNRRGPDRGRLAPRGWAPPSGGSPLWAMARMGDPTRPADAEPTRGQEDPRPPRSRRSGRRASPTGSSGRSRPGSAAEAARAPGHPARVRCSGRSSCGATPTITGSWWSRPGGGSSGRSCAAHLRRAADDPARCR